MTEATYDAQIVDLGEKIVGLTLLQAKSLSDYLKNKHGIEPAGGGVVAELLLLPLKPRPSSTSF